MNPRMKLGKGTRVACLAFVTSLVIMTALPSLVKGADPSNPGGSGKYSVEAWIYESGSFSDKVSGALFEIIELGKSAVSGDDGLATIDNVPSDTYTMRVTAMGYAINTRTNVMIPPGGFPDEDPVVVIFQMTATNDTDGDGLTDAEETLLGTDLLGFETWAAIICGGLDDSSQPNFETQCDEAVTALHSRGIDDSHMYYLSLTSSKRDPDGDKKNDVDDLSTKANVQYAIETWMASNSDADDVAFVYLVDHGGYQSTDIGYFTIGQESIYDYELSAWVDGVVCHNMTVMIDCCNAGTWESELTDDETAQNRILITSTTMDSSITMYIDENKVLYPTWTLFSHPFFQAIAEGASFEEAYSEARGHVFTIYNMYPTFWKDYPPNPSMYDWNSNADVFI